MKKPILILPFFLVLLFLSNASNAQEINKTHKDSLVTIIKKYYELNIKVFKTNSTVQEVDDIFELFAAGFTYVHPKYGGVYTREDLYNGYIRNQKNGMYDGKTKDVKIVNKIIGFNAVVVERVYVTEKDGEPKMTLFEFEKGKISRIFEYW